MTAEHAQRLHDKLTRGEPLTDAEQTTLYEWYARQDQDESALLERAPAMPEILRSKADIAAAEAQLVAVANRIQALTAEKELVQREITELRRQLTEKITAQPA